MNEDIVEVGPGMLSVPNNIVSTDTNTRSRSMTEKGFLHFVDLCKKSLRSKERKIIRKQVEVEELLENSQAPLSVVSSTLSEVKQLRYSLSDELSTLVEEVSKRETVDKSVTTYIVDRNDFLETLDGFIAAKEEGIVSQSNKELSFHATVSARKSVPKFKSSIVTSSSCMRSFKTQSSKQSIVEAVNVLAMQQTKILEELAQLKLSQVSVKNNASKAVEVTGLSQENLVHNITYHVSNHGEPHPKENEHKSSVVHFQEGASRDTGSYRDHSSLDRPAASTPQPQSVDHMAIMAKLQLLGSVTPFKFSGECCDFPNFREEIRLHLEDGILPDYYRKTFLKKFLSGKALQVVEQNMSLNFSQLLDLLADRYGNPVAITEAWVKKLTSGPPIGYNDTNSLRELGDSVKSAAKVLDSKSKTELNTKICLKQIVNRLPNPFVARWVQFIQLKEGNETIDDLSEFIESLVKVYSHPIYKPKVHDYNKSTKPNSSYIGSNVKQGQSKCMSTIVQAAGACQFCGSVEHGLNKCKVFLKDSIKSRVNFVKEKHLCFGCLGASHTSKGCITRLTCVYCNKKHPSCLHDDEMNKTVKDTNTKLLPIAAETDDLGLSNKSNSNNDVDSSETNDATGLLVQHGYRSLEESTTMLILPVYVYNNKTPHLKVLTYAILDDGSDSCFIKDSICDKTRTSGVKTKLQLKTLSAKSSVYCERVSNVTIQSFYDPNVTINLSDKLFSRSEIPGNHEDIPSPEIAASHDHLRKIAGHIAQIMTEVEIGLLIGNNCPSILCPLEVLRGQANQAYGIKTVLGWGIIGPKPKIKKPIFNHEIEVFNSQTSVHQDRGTQTKEIVNRWVIEAEDHIDDLEVKRSSALFVKLNSYDSLYKRFESFDSWYCLRHSVAICIRYVNRLRSKIKLKRMNSEPIETLDVQPITASEIMYAEFIIIKEIQKQYFPEEVKALSSGANISLKKNSSFYKLDPFIDERGLVKVGGRLRYARLLVNEQHPVIVPRSSKLSILVVRYFHCQIRHQGRNMTVNSIRSNGFWILGCSHLVRKLIASCGACKVARGKFVEQKMSDLPVDRVEIGHPPFYYSAVDCFGPYYIKIGRRQVKRYRLIFTCLTSRAIFLDTVDSLNTDSFINGLRRFLSRRGSIYQLRSDTGTNFVGAHEELRRELESMVTTKIQTFLKERRCTFKWQIKCNLKPGDIVLTAEDQIPRNHWNLATIHEVLPSKDNLIRKVSLRLPSGKVIKRPVNKMYTDRTGSTPAKEPREIKLSP